MSDEHDDTLEHYGILRKSGRYPWGSGANPYQRGMDFRARYDDLRKKGLSKKEIAKGLGFDTTTALTQTISISNAKIRAAEAAQALNLKERGLSNSAIGRRMGKNESAIRSLLDPAIAERQSILETTTNMLRDQVDNHKYIDIGRGTENHIGVSSERLGTAVAILKDEGYNVWYVNAPQLGVSGNKTTVKVLTKEPNKNYPELANNPELVKTLAVYSENKGRSYNEIKPPRLVDPDKIMVRYGPEGGAEKDGLIELRRDADYLDMGTSRYAQVRIGVEGDKYLKGMAIPVDNMPDGVDIIYNVPKADTGNKMDPMKDFEPDPANPFGSSIQSQKVYIDKNGKEQLTALNIVNDEGDWWNWSKTLSSQMLSKQEPKLAKQQLDLTHAIMTEELKEIQSLTNPTIKQELLRAFSDEVDAAAVHLKAAGLPRTSNHVIIPVPEMKDNEVYAPNYKNGEKVVLIRHPHGGIFEIPELTVNNRQPNAKSIIGNSRDAIAINAKVAEQLSGADFDGDTVLVIPNNQRNIKTMKPIRSLQQFDPRVTYKGYEGMKVMKEGSHKQNEMGQISNLITDMSVQGAPLNEIVRAVKHSMVVIDAAKHELNYEQSAIDNGIKQLRQKYQKGPRGGATTLISRSSARTDVAEKKPRAAADGGPIDKKTGELKFTPTGEGWYDPKGNWVPKTQRSVQMREVSDAHQLSTGTAIEKVYADYANRLKAMANTARKEMISTPNLKQSSTARKAYAPQVQSLQAKVSLARMNAPLERQAQLIGGSNAKARIESGVDLEADDIKKIRAQELNRARDRVGAKKQMIEITPKEWEAIQSGAISHSVLKNDILPNTDLRTIKELATPRTTLGLPASKLSRAKSMLASGYTQAEVAEALGVSVSTINKAIEG